MTVPAGAADDAAQGPPGTGPEAADGWTPGEPPLTTPWTDEVGPDNALPEYPRPQLVRRDWENLNGVWQFAAAAEGEQPPFGETLDERVLVPYPIESALSGIQRHEDRMWYRRTFEVPPNWHVGRGERLILNFGAVDYDARVWVNGEEVTSHRGGYDKFSVDITDALTGDGPQELIVWAEDLTDATQQPVGKQRLVPDRGIFYEASSGIWQTVWMEPVPEAHVTGLNMTPDIDTDTLTLGVEAAAAEGMSVQAIAYDDHRPVARATGAADEKLELEIPDAKLWSPDNPHLYDLKVYLMDGNRRVDRVESYFGMREVGMAKGEDGKQRLTLNGEILFQMSTLDQGYWPDGLHTAPTDEALRFDLEKHKEMGFNTVRKHIKVEPDRWFYHADRLGLLVWQDMPSARPDPIQGQWRDQFESELFEMVEEHDHWTSVVAWVPFNEGWGEWSQERTGELAERIKEMDPTRLVNAHSGVNCCDSLGDSGKGDMIDWHDYVGPATPMPDENRVAVDGEHGGFGLEVEGHMWFGEGHAYEMTPNKEALTRRYVENQQDVLEAAKTCGISAAVYTQITDVEHEVNGLLTYDRKVEKMDFDRVRAINEKIIAEADGSGEGVPDPDPGTPGLDGISFYPFSEGSGTTTADAVGEHDATLVGGPSWTTGVDGSAVEFNGDGQFADTGASILDTTGNYSVSAWVKLNEAGGRFQTAVSQDGDGTSGFFLQYSGADQRFAFSFAGLRALSPEKPETGRWYHLVGVRDAAAGTIELYLDGERVATRDACVADDATGNTVIGRAQFGGNQVDFLNGAVDQVRLFDRALDAGEVGTLYGSGQN
ncbi:glycosyl hydrolase family 2 [Haloactinopolyspora alba]|uniref:Glycosyl hydrolase family 2 n=1 Tax=Haloactinopolyspora alba TaxID=648780 RepID=A0A2P8E5F1_9ACTN|nr:LamG-like jellyroll fold domain-containing protein [Haloactinopolyspora alba]PSL04690.1 glycosyl hydrolase family 2 [Haloactinopolyspora alba]